MSKNDIIDVQPLSQERAQTLKSWGWVSYILHLIVAVAAVVPGAQISIVVLLVALVMDLVKKDDAEGSWQESHFKWRIGSVLWAGVLYLVTAPLFVLFYLPGFLAWTIISIWFLYRIVKGMARMNANQAVNG